MDIVCAVERLNENLRKRINAVTECILGLFVHRSNKIIMSDTTQHIRTSTQCYCCQWHECSGLSIFLFDITFFHSSQLTFVENWRLWSLSCSPSLHVRSLHLVPSDEEKTHHYKINFYSPCDKCYAYSRHSSVHFVSQHKWWVLVLVNTVDTLWWQQRTVSVSQIPFKRERKNIGVCWTLRLGFYLNPDQIPFKFVNCSNKHVPNNLSPARELIDALCQVHQPSKRPIRHVGGRFPFVNSFPWIFLAKTWAN